MYFHEPAAAASPGNLLKMWTLGRLPDILNESPHFDNMRFLCTLKVKKHWFHTIVNKFTTRCSYTCHWDGSQAQNGNSWPREQTEHLWFLVPGTLSRDIMKLLTICVSNLLASMSHTGRRVVLGYTLNTMQHVITKISHDILSKFTILCWAACTAIWIACNPQAMGWTPLSRHWWGKSWGKGGRRRDLKFVALVCYSY